MAGGTQFVMSARHYRINDIHALSHVSSSSNMGLIAEHSGISGWWSLFFATKAWFSLLSLLPYCAIECKSGQNPCSEDTHEMLAPQPEALMMWSVESS